MIVEFEHPDYAQTNSYRYDWVLSADPATVVFTNSEARSVHNAVAGSNPVRYRKTNVTKPSTLTGPYVVQITAVNAAGESAPVPSASFSVSAPGPVANIAVIDPHL